MKAVCVFFVLMLSALPSVFASSHIAPNSTIADEVKNFLLKRAHFEPSGAHFLTFRNDDSVQYDFPRYKYATVSNGYTCELLVRRYRTRVKRKISKWHYSPSSKNLFLIAKLGIVNGKVFLLKPSESDYSRSKPSVLGTVRDYKMTP